MKKQIQLITILLTISLAGCDYSCTWDYRIINQTNSTIDLYVTWGKKQTLIEPGDEQIFFTRVDLCTHRGKMPDSFAEYPENYILFDAEMSIDGRQMPEEIWKRKYWEFSSNAKRHATYTLILTDELIEQIVNINE